MAAFITPFVRLLERVGQLIEVRASRRQLADLDDAILKDIGISRAQAMFEASRPTWDNAPRPNPAAKARMLKV